MADMVVGGDPSGEGRVVVVMGVATTPTGAIGAGAISEVMMGGACNTAAPTGTITPPAENAAATRGYKTHISVT